MAHAMAGVIRYHRWKTRQMPNTDDIAQRIESSYEFAGCDGSSEKSVSACGASRIAVMTANWQEIGALRINLRPGIGWCQYGEEPGIAGGHGACELSSKFWRKGKGGPTIAALRDAHTKGTADMVSIQGQSKKNAGKVILAGCSPTNGHLCYDSARRLLQYGPFVAFVHSDTVQLRGATSTTVYTSPPPIVTSGVRAGKEELPDHAVMCYHAEEVEGQRTYRFKNSWGKNLWEYLVVEAGNNAAGAESLGALYFGEGTTITHTKSLKTVIP
jgi:hypothetical protein